MILLPGGLSSTRSTCMDQLHCFHWHHFSWYWYTIYEMSSLIFSSLSDHIEMYHFLTCASFYVILLIYSVVILLLFSIYFHVMQVLPLPNIPFFWVLFRTYSHWRALQVTNILNWLKCWELPYAFIVESCK